MKATTKNKHISAELLSAADEQKKQYFASFVVHHPNLDKAVEETLRHIRSGVDERIVLVCGPSGVGKNELIKAVEQRIIEAVKSNPDTTPACIPVVQVEAIAPKDGSFDFNDLWLVALKEMNERSLNKKIMYEEIEGYDKNGNRVILSKTKKGQYHQVLNNTLYYRGVQAFIINEAHHMLLMATGRKTNWSVNVLKSLAGSKTPIVMVGTYELLNYLELHSEFVDQIIRRTNILELPRYFKDSAGLKHFGMAAKELILNMPFEEVDPDLLYENIEYLFDNSLGRVGALKLWLMDAYAYALERQAKFLTKQHLEATRVSGYLNSTVLKGIEAGEKRMATVLSDGEIESKKELDKLNSQPSAAKNKAPFERNPKRDKSYQGLIKVKGGES